MAIPDAAGEVAYTAKVFPQPISFATGWLMLLAYLVVCPWEAVAIGRIAGYLFPALDSVELYRLADKPVYLPHVVVGLGLTGILVWLNYHGIRGSATFQNWTTFGALGLFAALVACGLAKGSPQNFSPLFSERGGLVWVLNGNFVAARRLLFGLGRRGLVDSRLGWVHPVNRTPGVAVIWVGLVTAAAALLGSAILVPITEVGSLASAAGWLAACLAYR